jgi:DNA-directed RNA polymerase specialized sigma24 family protein
LTCGALSSLTLPSHPLADSGTSHNESAESVRGAVLADTVRCFRSLDHDDRAELVTSYQAGATVHELATKFGIHRHTVSKHLRTAGVRLRLDGLNLDQIDQAEQLYCSGLSLARIADRLGVTANTVHARLRERGVPMRDTQGRVR